MQAPKAQKIPREVTEQGIVRTDNYYWLREKESPDVIAHLTAENAYTDSVLGDTKELQQKLFEEIKGRMNENDMSAPYKYGPYFYYGRMEAGKQYGILCRKKDSLDAPEEVLLDENVLAEGHEFLSVSCVEISPDHSKLTYAVDYTGDEQHTLYVKDLGTGSLLSEQIENVDSVEWANDNTTLLYVVSDETRRPYRVYRHILGTTQAEDALVFEDLDERFFVGIGKSRSDAYIFITSESKITTEVHYLSADTPTDALRVITPRVQGHEYHVSHHDNRFFIVTNRDAQNFKIMTTSVATPDEAHWEVYVPHREDVMVEGIDMFKDFMVIHELKDGLNHLRLRRFDGSEDTYVPFPEATYALGGGANPTFDTNLYRFGYSSMITPSTTYDFNIDTHELVLIKQKEVFGGYDRSQYVSERVWATAPDGERIPLSIAYRNGAKTGVNPCWLHGYGSYGYVQEARFSESRISLLDRGFVFAFAHIRGGGEGGRAWYEQGKFLHKKNTFTDFIASAEFLIQNGYAAPDKLVISGRSAGGLLMGAVINMRPDLFAAVVTSVPFVDVMNTMMDPTIPLTVTEYEEWGNPNEKEFYDYMHSYSPYDNVSAQPYPHMLVTAGLNDTRVQYWEPAKWVAKLREHKTDDHMLLLKTDMGSGHGGASGRYDAIKEVALEYAFALKALGMM